MVVVPRYIGWTIATHGDAPPGRTVYLGNDDRHYVWLAPSAAGPPPLPDCDAGKERARKKPAAKVKKRLAAKGSGRFVRGNSIGKTTRFRRKAGKYHGACRECGSNENTRNAGKDWFCYACHAYTKKRRGRR